MKLYTKHPIMSYFKYDVWNRCDVCGRFIAYKDFDDGKARRCMVTPDSDYSSEAYETLCIKCNGKEA
jgi:hypothetical protein